MSTGVVQDTGWGRRCREIDECGELVGKRERERSGDTDSSATAEGMVSMKGLQGEGDSTNGNGMHQTCLNRLRRPGRTRYA